MEKGKLVLCSYREMPMQLEKILSSMQGIYNLHCSDSLNFFVFFILFTTNDQRGAAVFVLSHDLCNYFFLHRRIFFQCFHGSNFTLSKQLFIVTVKCA